MKRTPVIKYTRVSKHTQKKNGVSLEDQSRQLDEFAKSFQLEIAAEFSEVGSASKEEDGSKRESFKEACRLALKNDWDILVMMPSRFSRTLDVYDRFVARGGRLICAKLGVDASEEKIRSALEVEITELEQRQRTAAIGLRRAREAGKLADHTVPDWARKKSIVSRQEKARKGYEEFERHAAVARASGASTPLELAMAFRKMGFKAPSTCHWKPNNVRRVLDTIAARRAAGGPSETARALSASNDDVDENHGSIAHAATAFNCGAGDVIVPASETVLAPANDSRQSDAAPSDCKRRAGYPLSPSELADFRELLTTDSFEPEEVEYFIRSASSPTLSLKARAKFLDWIARRRAA